MGGSVSVAWGEHTPGAWRGRESAHEVVDALCREREVDGAGLLEYLGGGVVGVAVLLRLRRGVAVGREDEVDGVGAELGAELHECVVDVLYVGIVGDGELALGDDATGVDVVVEEEGGDAGEGLAVDDSPVDWCCATIVGEQGCMDVECAEARHCPHYFGEHAERDNDMEVGIVAAQLLEEVLVLHLQGLQHGQTVGKGVLLDGRGAQHGGVATDGFVGLRHDSHYVIAVLYKSLERANGKLGCSHEHYAEVFLFHCFLVLF